MLLDVGERGLVTGSERAPVDDALMRAVEVVTATI
jgi:hypothetical protein